MSDSRFHLKVTFEVYGREFKWEPSLNWSAAPGECDERIARWFADNYAQAYDEFQEHNYRAQADQRKKAEKAAELEQLARLRKKYPDA
jgi:hypothetical protein